MQNQDVIYNFLHNNGLTDAAACGVMGNIEVKSGGNTEAYNSNENAIGIAQWEGSRRTSLQQFAAGMGAHETDLTAQLNFLKWESGQRGNWQTVNASTTPGAAAAYWDEYFEVSAGTTRQQRIVAAEGFFAALHASVPAPAPAESTQNIYIVKEGDTLSGIGAEHNIDWHEIYDANRAEIGDNPDKIFPGQRLIIPAGNAAAVNPPAPAPTPEAPPAPRLTTPPRITYVVQAGDTLSAIGERYGVDYHVIAAENALTNPDLIYPGQALVIRPQVAPNTYTVQAGDSLSAIGEKLNINWQELYARNKNVIGDNPDKIYPGQVLEY